MHNAIPPVSDDGLRVLLIGSVSGASLALAGWIQQLGHVTIAGPVPATSAVDAVAAAFVPQVVIVDADGLAVSLRTSLALLKHFTPPPRWIVVACDMSDALRGHCQAVGVDAVFSKTNGLESLAAHLAKLSRASVAADAAAR